MRYIRVNLVRYRERFGLTLSGVSERSGSGKSPHSMLESGEGNTTVETLWALADALGVPFGKLVDEASVHRHELTSEGAAVRLPEKSPGDPEIEAYSVEPMPDHRQESTPHPEEGKERIAVPSGNTLVGDIGSDEWDGGTDGFCPRKPE